LIISGGRVGTRLLHEDPRFSDKQQEEESEMKEEQIEKFKRQECVVGQIFAVEIRGADADVDEVVYHQAERDSDNPYDGALARMVRYE
jgi:regulator of RNase E activity RraA